MFSLSFFNALSLETVVEYTELRGNCQIDQSTVSTQSVVSYFLYVPTVSDIGIEHHGIRIS